MNTEVANTVAEFFGAVDAGDWARVKSLMTSPIHIDYSSFGAGDPADAQPSDVIRGWQGILPGFDHTHHQFGNLQVSVNGDSAVVAAYVTATHVIDADVWTVVGRYEINLVPRDEGWSLSSLRFVFKYQTGATTLLEEATRRASR